MKILGIEHIGIAVKSKDKISNFFENILEIKNPINEDVKDQKVLTQIFNTSSGKLELLESTSEYSPISKFLSKRGNAVHHIALSVENIEDAIYDLKCKNIPLIGDKPKIGAEGFKIIFIHPKATDGILIELCQKS
ncbi:MAG: methylmalonyl-CoA epimerase [Candidatus Marinimicrobia bacterium]|nr:methylmalonyl-CoA epimerase [Candidatus Neomarinimicrobiota bacterium]